MRRGGDPWPPPRSPIPSSAETGRSSTSAAAEELLGAHDTHTALEDMLPVADDRSGLGNASAATGTERCPRNSTHNADSSQPMAYQIRITGQLDSRWADWFEGLTITLDGDDTLITGPVVDQAALHGLLKRVRDLGMPLVSVSPVESGPRRRSGQAGRGQCQVERWRGRLTSTSTTTGDRE